MQQGIFDVQMNLPAEVMQDDYIRFGFGDDHGVGAALAPRFDETLDQLEANYSDAMSSWSAHRAGVPRNGPISVVFCNSKEPEGRQKVLALRDSVRRRAGK